MNSQNGQYAVQPEDLAEALLSGNYSGIYERFSPDFKQYISEADFTEMGSAFIQEVTSFTPSTVVKLNGSEQRVWISDTGAKGILAFFDETGMILGLSITNLDSYPVTDQALTETVVSPPFEGDWFVFWGGSNMLDNYHYEYESQRYAYDFVQEVNGYSYQGDPADNESYYAFGKDITAPADGTVIRVIQDIPDNTPVGVMNEKEAAGNVVVIDHGGEYSFLAHLKQGSVTVQEGDNVISGQVIGKLGNSGNSSEPHLHFQMSDGSDLFGSRSLNIRWKDHLRPLKGQTVTGRL
ncbi:peptidoglycan DD-metalloendopeptidase family protein [Paenibacillus sp. MMS20-IR301]|uniref:peptidoglycan DD-metalloendopeptidase family protein n=1 Tax=Paenibacillus sp. MMS20-IR301 TaxID=2895946 RepID=UPI0028E29F6A|nr:peptidoglycan DD-metalloendopeptidase family protein [Paenibacillus sp. MMS20-IR301]WNS42333.1 peptidoglycan DD-metalloendopeptidase family protein [Paenibacillus sp. MMS20-IR301]